MVEWIIELISKSVDLTRELSLKSWEDIVELQGVRVQEYPSGVSGEDS